MLVLTSYWHIKSGLFSPFQHLRQKFFSAAVNAILDHTIWAVVEQPLKDFISNEWTQYVHILASQKVRAVHFIFFLSEELSGDKSTGKITEVKWGGRGRGGRGSQSYQIYLMIGQFVISIQETITRLHFLAYFWSDNLFYCTPILKTWRDHTKCAKRLAALKQSFKSFFSPFVFW